MTTATMTDKQRRALDAMEALRRRGVLPKSGRKARGKFVAVQVTQPVAIAMPATQRSDGFVVLCRIVHAHGHVIECVQWPPPSWVAALSAGSADAAA